MKRHLMACLRSAPCRSFSTSFIQQARRQGTKLPIPKPSSKLPEIAVSADHALWAFFRNGKTLTSPKEDAKHGRSWTAEELRRKSFDDLHSLWIICLKERNILATQRHERRRQRIRTTGNDEAAERDRTVRRTMAGIKFVLNERFLAYQEALELAKNDGDIALPETIEDTKSPKTHKISDQKKKSTSVALKKKAQPIEHLTRTEGKVQEKLDTIA